MISVKMSSKKMGSVESHSDHERLNRPALAAGVGLVCIGALPFYCVSNLRELIPLTLTTASRAFYVPLYDKKSFLIHTLSLSCNISACSDYDLTNIFKKIVDKLHQKSTNSTFFDQLIFFRLVHQSVLELNRLNLYQPHSKLK